MSDNTNSTNNSITNDIVDENMPSLTEAPISTFKEILETEDEKLNTSKEQSHYKSIKTQNVDEDVRLQDTIPKESDETASLKSVSSYDEILSIPPNQNNFDWFSSREYIIFKNQLYSLRKNNNFILKEGKECKRLLDLKYEDLTSMVNNIQTSVIFVSTISGFFQATKTQFAINIDIIAVISITISTYISLILSISKYYKLDELKDRIQNLREKYSLLHNRIDYRMDVLGPWNNKHLWEHQDPKTKLAEWSEVVKKMKTDYSEIIKTKQELTTDFEIIMDTISRNKYNNLNSFLNYKDRELLFILRQKENELEKRILQSSSKYPSRKRPSIMLQHEELDNWADDDDSMV
jgi:succinate dehydrogenase flavin-adding protein (antitoxin of CptAB toxin-antitoxin module)